MGCDRRAYRHTKKMQFKTFPFISISPEGEGNILNTRDLDALNTVTAEVSEGWEK